VLGYNTFVSYGNGLAEKAAEKAADDVNSQTAKDLLGNTDTNTGNTGGDDSNPFSNKDDEDDEDSANNGNGDGNGNSDDENNQNEPGACA
jgi:hypothetical protein